MIAFSLHQQSASSVMLPIQLVSFQPTFSCLVHLLLGGGNFSFTYLLQSALKNANANFPQHVWQLLYSFKILSN